MGVVPIVLRTRFVLATGKHNQRKREADSGGHLDWNAALTLPNIVRTLVRGLSNSARTPADGSKRTSSVAE